MTYGWLLVNPMDMMNGRAYHVFHEKVGFWILLSYIAWVIALVEFVLGYCMLNEKSLNCF